MVVYGYVFCTRGGSCPLLSLPSFDVTFGNSSWSVVGPTYLAPHVDFALSVLCFFPLCVGSAMWALSVCPMRILDESLSLIGSTRIMSPQG